MSGENSKQMTQTQALALATLVIDFEIESSKTARNGSWAYELSQARAVLSQMLNRPNPGRFFISANERRKSISRQAEK